MDKETKTLFISVAVALGILWLLKPKGTNMLGKQKSDDADKYSEPKIASEALLNEYCRITGKDKREVSKWRFDRPTIRFKNLFKDVDFGFTTEPFISVHKEWMSSINTFEKEFIINSKSGHALKISCGVGRNTFCK